MWKSKLLNLQLLLFVFVLFCVSPVFALDDTSELEEFQELANSLSQESYKQEMIQIKSLTSLLLQELQQSPQPTMDESLLESLKNCEMLMKSSEYQQMKLSEQLRVISESQKLSNQLAQAYLTQQEMLSKTQLNALKITNDLLSHYRKLLEILQKIIKSQSEDTQIAIEEMQNALSNSVTLKQELDLINMLANKQAEEINALKKRGKGLTRSRIASISISGGGLILGTVGYFLRQDDLTKEIGNLLFYSGVACVSSGIITFGVSFTIPF